MSVKKKLKSKGIHERSDLFDGLPDDIVLSILCKLISTASSPSDFITILITCKRLNWLGLHPLVLSKACSKALAVRAKNWSDDVHRFLKLCVNAGNNEASYILGMIRFYCLQFRGSGTSLMAKAAIKSHPSALYSLALIQFNGSGGFQNDKDLRAGVALCARAAFLGHIDALRELGHCLQDGYGIRKNITEGRRLLFQANAQEIACVLCSSKPLHAPWQPHSDSDANTNSLGLDFGLQSDFGYNVPIPEVHPVNRFMVEWFELRGRVSDHKLRMCSHLNCGRVETRRNEYRRCSGCGKVNYCSRGCQAHDWRMQHKIECAPTTQWIERRMDQDEMRNGVDVDHIVDIEDREGF